MRAILTYHSIDDSRSPVSVGPDAFARHVEWLASGVVPVLPLAELAGAAPDRDAVAVTFDDGFVNFAERAWPLLRDAQLPVTLFVATMCVGGTNAWGGIEERGIPTLPLLAWDALRELAGEGLALGSHSRTHARLTDVSDERLRDELVGSAEDIETRTGARPAAVCYPYGDLDPRVLRVAREHYRVGCTTELRALGRRDDALALPRLNAFYYRRSAGLPHWGSAAFRGRLWARGLARGLRARLTGR